MSDLATRDLFRLKSTLEKQLEHDYTTGPSTQAKRFDFLIGEWHLTRTSFDENGRVAHETNGIVVAKYTFEGRVVQEDFYNYLANGAPYRAGTALYTFSPLSGTWGVAAVDACVGVTSYTPQWFDNEVRYSSTINLPEREVYTRSRIFNISEHAYEWEQEISLDHIAWQKNYHILNTRSK